MKIGFPLYRSPRSRPPPTPQMSRRWFLGCHFVHPRHSLKLFKIFFLTQLSFRRPSIIHFPPSPPPNPHLPLSRLFYPFSRLPSLSLLLPPASPLFLHSFPTLSLSHVHPQSPQIFPSSAFFPADLWLYAPTLPRAPPPPFPLYQHVLLHKNFVSECRFLGPFRPNHVMFGVCTAPPLWVQTRSFLFPPLPKNFEREHDVRPRKLSWLFPRSPETSVFTDFLDEDLPCTSSTKVST